MNIEQEDIISLQKYFRFANELQSSIPIISYYLKTYAISKGFEYMKITHKESQTISEYQQILDEWCDDLELLKSQVGLQNKQKNKDIFINFTKQFFLKWDKEFNENNITIDLAQNFLNCSLLFNACELFEPIDRDIIQKKKYVKDKIIEIRKMILSKKLQNLKDFNDNYSGEAQKQVTQELPKNHNDPINEGSFEKKSNAMVQSRNNNIKNIKIIKSDEYTQDMINTSKNIGKNDFMANGNPNEQPFSGHNSVYSDIPIQKEDFNNAENDRLMFCSIYEPNNVQEIGNSTMSLSISNISCFSNNTSNQTRDLKHSNLSISQKGKNKDLEYIIEKAKDYSKKAINELDFKRFKEATNNLKEALKILEDLTQQY